MHVYKLADRTVRDRRGTNLPLLHCDRKNGMRTAAGGVHLRHGGRTGHGPLIEDMKHLFLAGRRTLVEVDGDLIRPSHTHTPPRHFADRNVWLRSSCR